MPLFFRGQGYCVEATVIKQVLWLYKRRDCNLYTIKLEVKGDHPICIPYINICNDKKNHFSSHRVQRQLQAFLSVTASISKCCLEVEVHKQTSRISNNTTTYKISINKLIWDKEYADNEGLSNRYRRYSFSCCFHMLSAGRSAQPQSHYFQ